MFLPIFRDMCRTGVGDLAGRSMSCVFTEDRHLTVCRTAQASQCFGQFRLTITLHTGNPQYFASTHFQRNSIDRHVSPIVHRLQVFHMQNRLCGMCFFFVDRQDDFAAHHHFGQHLGSSLRRLNRTDHLPAAHDADSIGHGKHFTQLVCDKDDRFALPDSACA